MENEILSEVLNFIRGYYGESGVGPKTALVKEAVLDSVRTIELVYFIERKFSLSIPARCMVSANFETPEAVARMVSGLAR